MGKFIVFEGIEGSGKTTQVKKAGDYLAERNIPFILTSEPGGTQSGKEIRTLLLHKTSLPLSVKAELLLFAADRAQHVDEIIVPALKEGKVVLCDRFSDATIAYQGYGRGWEIDIVRKIDAFSSGSLKPDLTFLLDVPVDTGLGRISSRASNRTIQKGIKEKLDDRFEKENRSFHERVREGYLSLAENEPERFRVIDGLRGINEIHHEICVSLLELIGR
ncbi:MAG: dTMP kinase [Syntrophaceae bacterium]|nr:dTMP kinase [Syntrophaceae bacterium]